MTSLSYSQLAYQLLKRGQTYYEEGLVVDVEENGNTYQDTLVLKHNSNFKVFHFTTQPYLWDRYRQFCLHTTGSGKFHFRINPVTDDPYRIHADQTGYFSDTWADYAEMPSDLQEFAEEIYSLIQRIEKGLAEDKLQFDSHEPRVMRQGAFLSD